MCKYTYIYVCFGMTFSDATSVYLEIIRLNCCQQGGCELCSEKRGTRKRTQKALELQMFFLRAGLSLPAHADVLSCSSVFILNLPPSIFRCSARFPLLLHHFSLVIHAIICLQMVRALSLHFVIVITALPLQPLPPYTSFHTHTVIDLA